MPNTLLQMQEMPNVPWGNDLSRNEYIDRIKSMDAN